MDNYCAELDLLWGWVEPGAGKVFSGSWRWRHYLLFEDILCNKSFFLDVRDVTDSWLNRLKFDSLQEDRGAKVGLGFAKGGWFLAHFTQCQQSLYRWCWAADWAVQKSVSCAKVIGSWGTCLLSARALSTSLGIQVVFFATNDLMWSNVFALLWSNTVAITWSTLVEQWSKVVKAVKTGQM